MELFADGACSGNPGPGGWGVFIRYINPEKTLELFGNAEQTTNNRMELEAVINGLEALKCPCQVSITTDSTYVCDAFRKGWIKKWQANGWRSASHQPIKNQDLWKRLINIITLHQVTWHWIKGHNGHPENELVDKLAVMAREQIGR